MSVLDHLDERHIELIRSGRVRLMDVNELTKKVSDQPNVHEGELLDNLQIIEHQMLMGGNVTPATLEAADNAKFGYLSSLGHGVLKVNDKMGLEDG